jgi:AcrR family transcriptional regulator
MPALVATATRPDTSTRILDAAFGCIQDVGLSRTTVEDVARAAGIARQTVYRYFPSKDHLILALVLREEEKFLDGVRAAFASASDLETTMEEALLFCLRFAREHPLLDRLLDTDPEALLPFLTVRAAPVIGRARDVLINLLISQGLARDSLLEEAADAVVRVVISYALCPPDRHPEEVARELARTFTLALTGKEASPR